MQQILVDFDSFFRPHPTEVNCNHKGIGELTLLANLGTL